MNNDKSYTIKIAILTFLLLSIKYFISYSLNFNEDIFFKILKLSEVDFYEYAYMVESLSNFNFKFDWSIKQPAEKIQGFPVFSLIWHSIIFKIFGYFSFLILEYLFYFLLLLFFFKFIKYSLDDSRVAFFSIVLLLLFLEIILFLINIHDYHLLTKIKIPLYDIFSHRFPRPLITSTYFFSILYFSIKILNLNLSKIKSLDFIFLGLSLFFLINSFFYLAITCLLTLFFSLIFKFKKKLYLIYKQNIIDLGILFTFILLGFLTIYSQTLISEPSHFFRMGGFEISVDDKLYIAKVFLKKIFQLEILCLIFLCFFLRFNYQRLKVNKDKHTVFNFLFLFFICSFLSPFFFLIISNKVIALNHFWTIVKFTGFLFIYLVLINFFVKILFKKNKINLFTYLMIFSLLSFNFLNFYSKETKFDKNIINDREKLKFFLKKNNFINSNKELYTDEYTIGHLWLMLKNKYMLETNGFILSQTDKQIQNSTFNKLKIFEVTNEEFRQMLNEKKSGRNKFSFVFKYKYSVNSVKNYKPITSEYSLEEVKYINNTSPLIQWRTIIPNSEKDRLLRNYKNYKINNYFLPDLIILRNPPEENKILNSKYNIIFSNNTYIVFKRN